MLDCVLSVDIGTTSLKAGLITAKGEVVFFFKKSFADNTDRFVATKYFHCLKSALNHFEKTEKFSEVNVVAISISGNGPTIISSGGLTLRWNEEYFVDPKRTGVSLFLPRLIAFKELFPKEFERTQYLFSGPEYFVYELTGNPFTLLPEIRFQAAYWNDESLQSPEVNINPEKLPPFIEPGKSCGILDSKAAVYLNLPEGIPVFCGGPDFVAALIGTNTLEAGKICDRSGSSEGLNFCVEKSVFAEKIRTLPSVISTLWNCSYLIPGSSKMKMNRRLEAVKTGIEKLKKVAGENNLVFPDKITVTGGQSKDERFLQKKADATGMTIAVCNCNDAELIGDACVAFYGIGVFSSIKDAADQLVKEKIVYIPEITE